MYAAKRSFGAARNSVKAITDLTASNIGLYRDVLMKQRIPLKQREMSLSYT